MRLRAVKNATVIGLSRSREQDIDAVREALQGRSGPVHSSVPGDVADSSQAQAADGEGAGAGDGEAAIRYAKKYFQQNRIFARGCGPYGAGFPLRSDEHGYSGGATVVNIPDTVGYMNRTELR